MNNHYVSKDEKYEFFVCFNRFTMFFIICFLHLAHKINKKKAKKMSLN